MQFTKVKTIFITALVIGACVAKASGGGEAEAPKEGEGDAAAAAPMPKDQKEFYEKTGKLISLTNRIEEGDRRFKELVQMKATAKTPEEKQALIQQMLEVATQRNKDVESYNKTKSDLALRYPNQGEHLNRRYQTQSKRSLEELEGVAGLDELLSRTKKVVERKFAPFMEDEPKTEKPKVAKPVEEKPQRLRLEK